MKPVFYIDLTCFNRGTVEETLFPLILEKRDKTIGIHVQRRRRTMNENVKIFFGLIGGLALFFIRDEQHE